MQILTFLKRRKNSLFGFGQNGDFVISLKIVANFVIFISAIVNLALNGYVVNILTTYISTIFMIKFDEFFCVILPKEMIQNAKKMNSDQILHIGKDKNTFSKLLRKFR